MKFVWAWIAYKKKDGSCRVVKVAVVQDYKGSDKYGPTRFLARYTGSADFDIKCENVNK
jgi:hypothetical protein